MGLLARRISTWTTNCLFTAILVVMSLGFGRQVLIWWAAPQGTSAPTAVVPPGIGFDPASQSQLIRFGNQKWSIRRKAAAGRSEDAAGALLAECRQRIDQSRLPAGGPDPTERGFLAKLDREKPAAESPGQWRLYQWNEGCPMAVGVRGGASPPGSESGTRLADPGRRVVIWGVAVPAGPDRWTLWLLSPEGGGGSPSDGLATLPLPPECRQILSAEAGRGQMVVMFSGPEPPDRYASFYQRWFTEQGWKMTADQPLAGGARHQQYVAIGRSPAVAADVHLGVDPRGRCSGLLMTFELER